jgi:ABC-type branched-subunit amino acid transport system substrate-binding protein
VKVDEGTIAMRRALALPAAALAGALALSGCAGNAAGSGTPATPGGLRTGTGVTPTEIALGALTEYAGPFADASVGLVHGQQIWINETNAAGGICGRKIKLEVRDHRDDTGTATAQYAALESRVLGFLQIMGSTVTTALSKSMVDNETTAISLSRSSDLLTNPYVIIPASTYDVEMINGLSSLMGQGKIHDGDAVGVIWFDGEYGASSLRGVRYFAKLHHLTLREVKISATDANLRDAVTGFAGAPRVRAIALSTTPQQTASAAIVNQQLKLNVPLIGSSTAFTPALLAGPSARALGNLSIVSSSVPFSSEVPEARHIAGAYRQSGDPALPDSAVTYGYATGEIWGELLKRACANHELTRSGIQEALHQSTQISTDALVADLDLTKPGAPATRQDYLALPDPAMPGGLRQVTPLFLSPEARSYVAPHQSDN